MTSPKKIEKDNDKDKDNDEDKDEDILRTPPKSNPRNCDIWDTEYNSDNWEPEFMTIFVTWQLIVTLDSIRNSCDVFHHKVSLAHGGSCIIRPSRAPQARGEAWEVYKE